MTDTPPAAAPDEGVAPFYNSRQGAAGSWQVKCGSPRGYANAECMLGDVATLFTFRFFGAQLASCSRLPPDVPSHDLAVLSALRIP